MKRILTLTLAGVMAASSVVYAADFPDIENHWAYDDICVMQEKGILNGYDDGTFRPEGIVTRAEAAKILSKLSGISGGDASFSDVSEADWFSAYAASVGEYIPGDGEFSGNEPITREDAAVAAVRILNIPSNKMALLFSDRDEITYKDEIAAAVASGIITGFEDGSFRPEAKLTRAQLCTMYNRAFSQKTDDAPEAEVPAEKTWKAEKLCDADIENFMSDVAVNEQGRLMFIEKDEPELIFQVNFPEGRTERDILWNTRKFKLSAGQNAGEYSDFVPLSLYYDNNDTKTYMFGYFKKFTDGSGNGVDVQHYMIMDITIDSGIIYCMPDEQYMPYKGKYEPELLFISAGLEAVFHNGHNAVFKFERRTGRYRGELYGGNERGFNAFLNRGDVMLGIDSKMNMMSYNSGNLSWSEPEKSFSAQFCGTRDNLFWLWDTVDGKLITSDTDGKEKVLYDDIKLENVELSGIDAEKLDSNIKILSKDEFVVYDGSAMYLISRKHTEITEK